MATQTAKLMQELRRQRLPPLPSLRDLLKMYQLNAIKHLSQNFLLDHKLTGKIVKAAGNISDCAVVEVGPGPGGITRSILERHPKKVILIEKDKRFKPFLKTLEDSCPGKVETYWGDVMSFEMSQILPQDLRMPWEDRIPQIHIIGNLPFSISTPLISRWLSDISGRKNAWSLGRVPLTLTFQKEVAERLTADVGNEQRSRLSVMAQHLTHASMKFVIKGSAFVPAPDVDVGVVKFVPLKEPQIQQPYKLVEKVVRQAFCMRGKFACRPLSTLFPMSVRLEFTKMFFDISMVFSNTRPYGLTMEDFQRLCDAYAEIIRRYPEIEDYNYRGFKPDETWEAKYGAKYESFKSDLQQKASRINPLAVISEDLAQECATEILIEERDQDEFVYVK